MPGVAAEVSGHGLLSGWFVTAGALPLVRPTDPGPTTRPLVAGDRTGQCLLRGWACPDSKPIGKRMFGPWGSQTASSRWGWPFLLGARLWPASNAPPSHGLAKSRLFFLFGVAFPKPAAFGEIWGPRTFLRGAAKFWGSPCNWRRYRSPAVPLPGWGSSPRKVGQTIARPQWLLVHTPGVGPGGRSYAIGSGGWPLLANVDSKGVQCQGNPVIKGSEKRPLAGLRRSAAC